MNISPENFFTLDDVDLFDKKVLVRVDLNSPINPFTGELLSDFRIRAISDTLRDLSESAVVLLSHQSRPGLEDFVSLRPHYEILSEYSWGTTRFVPDVMGPTALKEISKLERGEVLLLDNIRYLSEELLDGSPEKLSQTTLVKKLHKHFDLFVNDAFAAIHRAHTSLIGFPLKLPSVIGRLMEKELSFVEKIFEKSLEEHVLILGGAKPRDRLKVIEYILSRRKSDFKFLLGGILGKIFLVAKYKNVPKGIKKEVEKYLDEIKKAEKIIEKFENSIFLPEDLAIKKEDQRIEKELNEIKEDEVPLDIGEKTVKKYSEVIKNADLVFANGPLGLIEDPIFMKGTKEILSEITRSKGVKIAGGGHLSAIVEITGIEDKFNHISTGGGAVLHLLSGEKPVALEVLEREVQKKYHGRFFK